MLAAREGPPEICSTCNVSRSSKIDYGGTNNMKSKRHTPEQVIRKLAEGDKLL